MAFKDRIKIARGDRLQREFAEQILVDITTIQKYESGVSMPNSKTLMLIYESTGVNLHWLLTGEGVPYNKGIDEGIRTEDGKFPFAETRHHEVDGTKFTVEKFTPPGGHTHSDPGTFKNEINIEKYVKSLEDRISEQKLLIENLIYSVSENRDFVTFLMNELAKDTPPEGIEERRRNYNNLKNILAWRQ